MKTYEVLAQILLVCVKSDGKASQGSEEAIKLIEAYADQQVKAERNKVIDECIRVFDCNEYYYGDIVQSMLESLKLKQP